MWRIFYTVLVASLLAATIISPITAAGWVAPVLMTIAGLVLAAESYHQMYGRVAPSGPRPPAAARLWRWLTDEDRTPAHDALLKRADRQHEQFCCGDPHGFYGDKLPPAELMRPEYVVCKPELKAKPLTTRRQVGGDSRDALCLRVAEEIVRINHLRRLAYPSAQDQAEMLAIQHWLSRERLGLASHQNVPNMPMFLGEMSRQCLGYKVDVSDVFAEYLCDNVAAKAMLS